MKALLLILVCTISAYSQNIKEGRALTRWEMIDHSEDIKATVYYAPESVKRKGNEIKLWAKWDFPEGANRKLAPEWYGPTIGSFRAFMILSCEEKTVRALTVIGYGMSGNVVAEERGNLDVDEKPGTVGNAIFSYFCERDAKPPTERPKLKP